MPWKKHLFSRHPKAYMWYMINVLYHWFWDASKSSATFFNYCWHTHTGFLLFYSTQHSRTLFLQEGTMCTIVVSSAHDHGCDICRYIEFQTKFHNWWRCWLCDLLLKYPIWFTSFEHGQSSNLNLRSYNWAQTNGTVHKKDPAHFYERVVV